MRNLTLLPVIAFLALVGVFFARSRSSKSTRSSRMTWAASGVGILALGVSGLTIPIQIVDGWLGGHNLNNLFQNVFTLVAFWLVFQGMATQEHRSKSAPLWWPLFALLAVMSGAFFAIERGPTTRFFIAEHSTQFSLWLYASVYMAGIAGISIYMAFKLFQRSAGGPVVIAVGASLAALGSLVQIVFLTASLTGFWPADILRLVDGAFFPTFYPGVALIGIGIAKIHADHRRRIRRVNKVSKELQDSIHQLGSEAGVAPASVSYSREVALGYLYSLVINAHDATASLESDFPDSVQERIWAAEDVLSLELLESQEIAAFVATKRSSNSQASTLTPFAGERGSALQRKSFEER